jgi:hypothetical protein
MVQAFGADNGDGIPENQSESVHASLIGEVMDFVKENKTVSTIAAIGAAAGSVYLARAPIGRFLGKLGCSLFAAEEAVCVAAKFGKAPVGRQLANVEKVVATGVQGEGAIATAVKGEEAIVSGVKAEEAIVSASKATEGSRRPLLDALDDAAKAGKTKAPEPWVYHPENRVILKDLPKGGAGEIKSAGEGIESAGTIGSTHSPAPGDIASLVKKHRFLHGK